MNYRDADGNVVSLETLCRKEPEWAASRIRELMRQNEELLRFQPPPVILVAKGEESTK